MGWREEADSAAQQEDRPRAGSPYGQLGGPCPWRSEQHTVPTLTPEAPASAPVQLPTKAPLCLWIAVSSQRSCQRSSPNFQEQMRR